MGFLIALIEAASIAGFPVDSACPSHDWRRRAFWTGLLPALACAQHRTVHPRRRVTISRFARHRASRAYPISRTWLVSVPMPVMVSSTVSPSLIQACGSMPRATPEGVPVAMVSKLLSLNHWPCAFCASRAETSLTMV